MAENAVAFQISVCTGSPTLQQPCSCFAHAYIITVSPSLFCCVHPYRSINYCLLLDTTCYNWNKNGLPLLGRMQACKSSSAQKQPCNCVWLPHMPTKSSQCFYLLLLQHPSTSVDATTIPSSHLLFDWQN